MMNEKDGNVSRSVGQFYLDAAKVDLVELYQKYHSSSEGLTDNDVKVMRGTYGTNEISRQKPPTFIRRLASAFMNPFTAVLFLLVAVSFVTDVVFVDVDHRDYTSVIIVFIMVALSGTLRFIQESRSGKEAEKLKAMVKVTALVQRKGSEAFEIPLSEVVVGDVVHLAAGDMIPADLRIISAKDLFVSQSAVTGESNAQEKLAELKQENSSDYLGCSNLAFMGSNVVSGSAVALVIVVGDKTVFGSMAKLIIEDKNRETSFNKGVNSVSWLLVRFMCVMVPIVFFINGFTKGTWLEAFIFGLSVAVGLTPEMLPMIVTTNLARGAVQLGRKKTIVKNLNSIQNLGAIDILCADKTGTLTQNEVILERYLDAYGNVDENVFRYAFLNSYYQTGLKNLMDVAVLNRLKEGNHGDLTKGFKKVDEIPFDFNRRRMSVVIQDGEGKTWLLTKGAVEEMLAISSFVGKENRKFPLTEEMKRKALQTVDRLNADGMRVLAIASKIESEKAHAFSVDDEQEMVLIGYLAFLDPPKESASTAIYALKNLGVSVKILTGDNDAVTATVCRQVGMEVSQLVLGSEIEKFSDPELAKVVENANVFAKVSPQQKARIVKVLRENNHVVGLMGDGINDASAMKASDVGISVDTAVDIAKESADIILLEKNLMVLVTGITIGRATYANIIKYIKMSVSSNFGNVFSILIASAFLPFLPMLPLQILFLNMMSDFFYVSIPWDHVDKDYLEKPRKWDAPSIGKFMLWMGPTSSVFDICTFLLMFFIICPLVVGGSYGAAGINKGLFAQLFQTGWFVESLITQTLVIHMIRTAKIPFIQSRASSWVMIATVVIVAIALVLPYTFAGRDLGMTKLPPVFFPWLAVILFMYMVLATIVKRQYIRKYRTFL